MKTNVTAVCKLIFLLNFIPVLWGKLCFWVCSTWKKKHFMQNFNPITNINVITSVFLFLFYHLSTPILIAQAIDMMSLWHLKQSKSKIRFRYFITLTLSDPLFVMLLWSHPDNFLNLHKMGDTDFRVIAIRLIFHVTIM